MTQSTSTAHAAVSTESIQGSLADRGEQDKTSVVGGPQFDLRHKPRVSESHYPGISLPLWCHFDPNHLGNCGCSGTGIAAVFLQ